MKKIIKKICVVGVCLLIIVSASASVRSPERDEPGPIGSNVSSEMHFM